MPNANEPNDILEEAPAQIPSVIWQVNNGTCYLFRNCQADRQTRLIATIRFDWPPDLNSRVAREHERKAMNVIARAYEDAFP